MLIFTGIFYTLIKLNLQLKYVAYNLTTFNCIHKKPDLDNQDDNMNDFSMNCQIS